MNMMQRLYSEIFNDEARNFACITVYTVGWQVPLPNLLLLNPILAGLLKDDPTISSSLFRRFEVN